MSNNDAAVQADSDAAIVRSDAPTTDIVNVADVESGHVNGISVVVNPATGHVVPNATLQFRATVTGTTDTAVAWSIQEGATAGSVSATGLFTASSTVGTFHLSATSHADHNVVGTANIIVSAASGCGSLAAAGTWEHISPPPGVSTQTAAGVGWTSALLIDPFDPATVWLGTCHGMICPADQPGGLYKSTDCGTTWIHVNTGRNGSELDTGSLVSIAIDPVDPGVIYIAPIYGPGGLWKSTNGGVDWDQLTPPGSEIRNTVQSGAQIDSISLDPTNHRHIVIGTHANCAPPYDPTCQAESTDAGATWRLFRSPNSGNNWEEGAGPWVINATTWVYGGLHLWRTTDNGANWINLNPDPASFFGLSGGEVETHSIPHAADGSYYLTTGQGIIRSTDEGVSWSLIPNSGGQSVGFVIAGGHMYSSNEWSSSYHIASESDPTTWTVIPPPRDLPPDQGAPYIDYDAVHHVLYSSNFAAGAWRVVMP